MTGIIDCVKILRDFQKNSDREFMEVHHRKTENLVPRILIVDDAQENRQLLRLYLKKYKLEIHEAASGEETLNLIRNNEYDLILMDIQIPIMDGYEITKQIRIYEKEKKLKENYIVACTAHAFPEDINKALQAGCNEHMAKPIRREQLLNVLQAFSIPLELKT